MVIVFFYLTWNWSGNADFVKFGVKYVKVPGMPIDKLQYRLTVHLVLLPFNKPKYVFLLLTFAIISGRVYNKFVPKKLSYKFRNRKCYQKVLKSYIIARYYQV